jgi:hypothetical protein
MKIETLDGNLDTDKMTDREAEVYEAMNNFYKVCERYNISMFARVIFEKGKASGAYYAQKFEKGEDKILNAIQMMGLMNGWLNEATGGAATIEFKDI